ncbi:MAG TPA: glycosyltransferase family 39 protein [Thermoanaerobaculia bacterium]|nr:glycosyltransferase family 39 protein [Thermoanaerobaculia bacterium]
MIVAAVLRLHDLGLQAYDGDELYAVRIRGGSLSDIASLMGRSAFHDLHPPVSYLTFMPWVALFGPGETAVRSLPLVLGVLAVGLLGLVGRRVGGVWTGLAAAAFLAFNPLHIAYSQEARPYSLAVTLTIAAHLFFLRSLGDGRRWDRIVYALLCVAAIYTHYFALLALLPHGLIALGMLLTGDRDSRLAARQTLLTFVCAMATFIAWLPALAHQAAGQPQGSPLGMYDLGESPLNRTASFLIKVAGLGAAPFLLAAAFALLVLLTAAFARKERLPASPSGGDGGRLLPRWMGALALLAGIPIAAGLALLAPRLLGPARQVLLAGGYSPDTVEREMRGLMQFTLSIPLTMCVIGALVLVWPWISRLLDRLPLLSASGGRPLAVTFLIAGLLLAPVGLTLALAFKGVPFLSPRNLLLFEPPLALALGMGAVRLTEVRWGRLLLAPLILCLAVAGLQYETLSWTVGLPGTSLGMWTGAWRDLSSELNQRSRGDMPLVVVDAPRSDPALFYLQRPRVARIRRSGQIERVGLENGFRFIHLQGYRPSEALLSDLSRRVPLRPRFQVDEFVVYESSPTAPSRGPK